MNRIKRGAGRVGRAAGAAVVAAAGMASRAGAASAQEAPVVGAAEPWQFGQQAAASPVMAQLTDFHTLLLWIIAGITLVVFALLAFVMIRFNARANPTPAKTAHSTVIEVIWTVIPVVILIVIAVPSFKLLYFQDRIEDAEMTIKAIGRQWYWDYEYPDHGLAFSAYMIPDEEIQPGQRRLLETDPAVVLPTETNIRIQVTAGDVLHSWAVPAFGIKMDAVPGRLNETWVRILDPGTYYGQCSELCGLGHAFMPIMIKAVPKDAFAAWVETARDDYGVAGFEPQGRVAAAAAAE